MARILITSGPTRQYLDPVRYLTNASSGKTGAALAQAVLDSGNEVVIVSGPVRISYPSEATVYPVETTEEMLETCLKLFPSCDGLIGVAAPCDYRPVNVSSRKMSKSDFTRSGELLMIAMTETPDILAALGRTKRLTADANGNRQWIVGFALETNNHRERALEKLQRKRCDMIVLNDPGAISGAETHVEMIAPDGKTLGLFSGSKDIVARSIFSVIQSNLLSVSAVNLIDPNSTDTINSTVISSSAHHSVSPNPVIQNQTIQNPVSSFF